MTAYSRGSRGPRVDSGVAGIRTTLAAARSHQAPAAARRFPVRQRGPGGMQRAVGRQGESRVCPPPPPPPHARRTPTAWPPRRPSPPRPRGPAALPRPPAARFYGNGRAPEQGRHDGSEPQRPSGSSSPAWWPRAVLRQCPRSGCSPTTPGLRARLGRGRPKHLGAPETAAHSATEGSAQAHSELAPPNLGCPRLLEARMRKGFPRPSPRTPD